MASEYRVSFRSVKPRLFWASAKPGSLAMAFWKNSTASGSLVSPTSKMPSSLRAAAYPGESFTAFW
ncbi:MAG: hypothetical protein QM765_01315 [Myxococcales bacterium]